MLLFTIFAGLATALSDFDNTRVSELEPSNWPIKADQVWMVMFYSPDCGPCNRLKPTFIQQAAETNLGKFGAVDCIAHEWLCFEHNIAKYPTVKLFAKGQMVVYNGAANKMAEYVNGVANAYLPITGQTTRHQSSHSPSKNIRASPEIRTKPHSKDLRESPKNPPVSPAMRGDLFVLMAHTLAYDSKRNWQNLQGPKWVEQAGHVNNEGWWNVFKAMIILAGNEANQLNDAEAAKLGQVTGIARLVMDNADLVRLNMQLDEGDSRKLTFPMSSKELRFLQIRDAPMWALEQLVPSIKNNPDIHYIVEKHKTIWRQLETKNRN